MRKGHQYCFERRKVSYTFPWYCKLFFDNCWHVIWSVYSIMFIIIQARYSMEYIDKITVSVLQNFGVIDCSTISLWFCNSKALLYLLTSHINSNKLKFSLHSPTLFIKFLTVVTDPGTLVPLRVYSCFQNFLALLPSICFCACLGNSQFGKGSNYTWINKQGVK